MNDTIIAFRAKEQLAKFLGKVFTHFRKPAQKFMFDMLYGIQASATEWGQTPFAGGIS